jgi:hypothetical protein
MSPAQTVAETKTHKGQSPTGFFVAQNARTGHFAVTVCYALVLLFIPGFNKYYIYINNSKKSFNSISA